MTPLSTPEFPGSAPRTKPTCSSNPKAIQSRKRQDFRANHFAENALSSRQITPCTLNRCPVLNMLTSSIWFDVAFCVEEGPVAASELSHARLSGRRAMFFLNALQPASELLAFSATSLAQFPSCVVHDWSGLRIVFCPTRKLEPPGLKFLAFAVERCRINAEKHRQYLRVYVTQAAVENRAPTLSEQTRSARRRT
jgi:hypothetical protein